MDGLSATTPTRRLPPANAPSTRTDLAGRGARVAVEAVRAAAQAQAGEVALAANGIRVADPAAYQLVAQEAVRALDFQRAALDSLRTRVGVLLSGATIATSFLGGLAVQRNTDTMDWLAIVLFAGFACASLRILWPEAESAEGFTARPSEVIEFIIEGTSLERWEVERELALHMENQYDANDTRHLGPLTNWFRWAIVLLILEILVWILAI